MPSEKPNMAAILHGIMNDPANNGVICESLGNAAAHLRKANPSAMLTKELEKKADSVSGKAKGPVLHSGADFIAKGTAPTSAAQQELLKKLETAKKEQRPNKP